MTAVHTKDHADTEEAVRLLSDELATATCAAERRRVRGELALATLHVADSVAHRYAHRGVDMDDLEQVARTALVSAARRYDPDVGSAFLAYAVPSIIGEVKRYFRDHTWAVRPPRRLQELRLERNAAEEDLRHALRRDPTPAELADALDITETQLHEVRRSSSAYRSASLDAPTDAGATIGDHLPDPADAIEAVDTHLALVRALDDLTDRERRLIHLRFVAELTQSEIGERLGVSQMQVSRLLSALYARLRPAVMPAAS